MALITNTDSTILPYNTDYMVYDLDRQMYLLTLEGVRRLVGEDLIELAGSELKAELIRYEVSQDIYNFIASYSLNKAFNYKVWLMAKDTDLRSTIQRVLADQIRYYITSGAGSLKEQHGINIEKGKALDINKIRGLVRISPSAETLLLKSGLLYVGLLYYPDFDNDGTW